MRVRRLLLILIAIFTLLSACAPQTATPEAAITTEASPTEITPYPPPVTNIATTPTQEPYPGPNFTYHPHPRTLPGPEFYLHPSLPGTTLPGLVRVARPINDRFSCRKNLLSQRVYPSHDGLFLKHHQRSIYRAANFRKSI